jgi:hypothetical protein
MTKTVHVDDGMLQRTEASLAPTTVPAEIPPWFPSPMVRIR